jgi:hypothetical protein
MHLANNMFSVPRKFNFTLETNDFAFDMINTSDP